MQYKNLGSTGLKVSRLCLGTMTFGWSADEKTSHQILDLAFDRGLNFLDTADVYTRWVDGNAGGESETIIGAWLRNKPRYQVIVATKVRGRMDEAPNSEGLSRQHIMHAVEESLRRLQTDYIDLYQVHFPDEATPLDETLRALDDLVRSGKVRYIGASNFPAWLLMKSMWLSDVHKIARFDCLQPHYSLFNRAEVERELVAVCRDQQIGMIPYSPLAGGFLTGKYSREDPESADSTRLQSRIVKRLIQEQAAFDALEKVQAIANAHQVPVAHVGLAWLLAKDYVTAPIIGVRSVSQLDELLGAVDLVLSADELDSLNEMSVRF